MSTVLARPRFTNGEPTDASLMARFKELEEQNCPLKNIYAEERLKTEIV